MSTPHRSWLQQRIASTPQGKQINGILAIADGPAPAENAPSRTRYARALVIRRKYDNIASSSWWKQLPMLWDVFNDTEQFYKEFPENTRSAS